MPVVAGVAIQALSHAVVVGPVASSSKASRSRRVLIRFKLERAARVGPVALAGHRGMTRLLFRLPVTAEAGAASNTIRAEMVVPEAGLVPVPVAVRFPAVQQHNRQDSGITAAVWAEHFVTVLAEAGLEPWDLTAQRLAGPEVQGWTIQHGPPPPQRATLVFMRAEAEAETSPPGPLGPEEPEAAETVVQAQPRHQTGLMEPAEAGAALGDRAVLLETAETES